MKREIQAPDANNYPKSLPLLPGHIYEDHLGENHHKVQQFNLVNNINCQKTNFIKQQIDDNLIDSMRSKTPLNLTYGSQKKVENDYIPRIQPPWLKHDRQVLRFYAYFQEAVVEDPKENYRLRQCRIYFYLSDNTIHVNEPRVENSGLTQGVFIKRQQIPQKMQGTGSSSLINGDFYKWDDFRLAINVNFFERVFRIYDCDAFTREFYDYMGAPVGSPQAQPHDTFETLSKLKDLKIPPPDTKEYKEYIEVSLGVGHPNGGLEKYLNNDRRVLSFSVLWYDDTLEGGTNYYTLNFFLADDTIEVKQVRKHNSGKDPFPLLLRRGKVPKTPILTHYPGMTLQKEEFYSPKDLMIGSYVRVFSKECLIYDCDDFTRAWYQQAMGLNMEPIKIEQERPLRFTHPVPPYNGYGTPQDSLGSVYALQPKPPKKDVNKMYTQDQYILRFEARLVSKSKDDNIRKFIISFFCGDDTVMVYEEANKNSGIWKGKFLERTKLVNPETKQYFKDKDLQVGQIIQVSIWQFQLLRPDDFTINYMRERTDLYPDADIGHVIGQLQNEAQKYSGGLNEFLVDFLKKTDRDAQGYIDFVELALGIKELGFNISYQQEYTLFKYFDTDGTWKISMKDLFVGLGGKQ